MKRSLLLSLLVLVLPACRSVDHYEAPEQVPVTDTVEVRFAEADSLHLAGEFQDSRSFLLSSLDSDSASADQAIFRLLGLYSQRAMEDEFILLLDSLESCGWDSLGGWKVSALDMAGRPDSALSHVPEGDLFLRRWLEWRLDTTSSCLQLGPQPSPSELYMFSQCAAPDMMTREDIEKLLQFPARIPSVRRSIILGVLEASPEPSPWRDSVLSSLPSAPDADLMILRDMAERDSGDVQFWRGRVLVSEGASCSLAVEEMLDRFILSLPVSWSLVDRLLDSGYRNTVLKISSLGDQWYRMGCELALLHEMGEYGRLLEAAADVAAEAPDSLRARASLFRARGLRGAGRSADTYYGAYLDFARNFPDHPLAREAAYNTGKYHDCEQEWARAAEAYLVSLSCGGSYGGDERAHWRGGFCLYMSGRTREADSIWAAGCSGWPQGYWRDEMLFWRARLSHENGAHALGDSLLQTAALEHPWEFYGMLASRRMGSGCRLSFPVSEIQLGGDRLTDLIMELTSRGLGTAAVEVLLMDTGSDIEERARILSLMGRHGEALTLLRRLDSRLRDAGDGRLPDSLLAFYFPSPYHQLASSATDTLELQPSMLQGIMREESYFNRWIVSSAGARGAVQLMPGTAADVARWHGLPPLTEEEFFDPFASVPYGAIYINRQLSGFHGEPVLFLAAYNAGPGNASRWVDYHGWNSSDPELYIEQITYRETRMYVKKVLRSAWIYERR